MTSSLEDLLLGGVPDALADQLAWLERAADAAQSSSAELGDSAQRASLELRAALGAFVEFSRGPQGPSEELALNLTVRALLASALQTLYGALAAAYRDLGNTEIELASECRELSRLWSTLQRSISRGEKIRPEVYAKLEAIRAKLTET